MKKLYVLLTLAAVWLSVGVQGVEVTEQAETHNYLTRSVLNSAHQSIYYVFVTVNQRNLITDIMIPSPNFLNDGIDADFKGTDYPRDIEKYKQEGLTDLLLVSYQDIFTSTSNSGLIKGQAVARLLPGKSYATEKVPGVNCDGNVMFVISNERSSSKKFGPVSVSSKQTNNQIPFIKVARNGTTCHSFFHTRRSLSKAGRSISATAKKWKPSLPAWARKGTSAKQQGTEAAPSIEVSNINFDGARINGEFPFYEINLSNQDIIKVSFFYSASGSMSGTYEVSGTDKPIPLDAGQVFAIYEKIKGRVPDRQNLP